MHVRVGLKGLDLSLKFDMPDLGFRGCGVAVGVLGDLFVVSCITVVALQQIDPLS